MSNKKKIFICLFVIFILIIGFSIFFNKSNETVLETYTLNQQGLMKNEKNILDEKFDEKGNLTYYKYKSPDNDDILEFNFKYEYDDKNRIVKASLNDNDYIQIEYDENNRISKMYENISNSLSDNRDFIEFSFDYLDNDEIIVDKNITYSENSENEYKQHYTLNYKTLNYSNKECILLTEFIDDNSSISEILYEKGSKDINYSNFYDLINIVPLGYSTEDNTLKNTQTYDNSLLTDPVFFNGNIIYIKNHIKGNLYSDYINIEANNYYDNMNRLLKQETNGYEVNNTINCMYKSINSKEYYEYMLVKIYSDSSTKFTYIQNKIYLDDNNKIYKKETVKSDEIDEKEYNYKLKKFEKYFEKENVYKKAE